MHYPGIYLVKLSNTSAKMVGIEPGTLRYSFTSISTCFLLMPPSQQWH